MKMVWACQDHCIVQTVQEVKQQDRKLNWVDEPKHATMLLPQGPGVGQDLTRSDRVVGGGVRIYRT